VDPFVFQGEGPLCHSALMPFHNLLVRNLHQLAVHLYGLWLLRCVSERKQAVTAFSIGYMGDQVVRGPNPLTAILDSTLFEVSRFGPVVYAVAGAVSAGSRATLWRIVSQDSL